MTTLVLGAYAPEIAGLAPHADAVARAVGIGLVEAAAGAERAIFEVRPTRVLLVGTAGALPCARPFAVGEVAVAVGARLALRPGEEAPDAMPLVVAAQPQLAASLALRSAWIACPTGITVDDSEAARVAALGELEHLEAFAVLRAAARAGIPATAILAVANRAGRHARAEWRTHRQSAEAVALVALQRLL